MDPISEDGHYSSEGENADDVQTSEPLLDAGPLRKTPNNQNSKEERHRKMTSVSEPTKHLEISDADKR